MVVGDVVKSGSNKEGIKYSIETELEETEINNSYNDIVII